MRISGVQRLTSSVSGYFKITIWCLFILIFTTSVCISVLIYQRKKNKTGIVQKGGQVTSDNTPIPIPKPIPLSQPPTSQPAFTCKSGFTNSNTDTCTCVPCEVCLSEWERSEWERCRCVRTFASFLVHMNQNEGKVKYTRCPIEWVWETGWKINTNCPVTNQTLCLRVQVWILLCVCVISVRKYNPSTWSGVCTDCESGTYSISVGATETSTCLRWPTISNSTSGARFWPDALVTQDHRDRMERDTHDEYKSKEEMCVLNWRVSITTWKNQGGPLG